MSIFQRIKSKFWWIDVVYPLAVALFILGVITMMVYAGRPSSRLALMAEQELLNFSLRFSPNRHVLHPGKALVVTTDVIEMQRFPRAPRGVTPDVTAQTYADIVTSIARLEPEEIVLLWHGENQRFDAEYLEPLVSVVQKLDSHIRFTFATAPEYISDLQARFTNEVRIVDDSSCLFPDVEYVHSYCYFSPGWSGMLAQHLAEESIPEAKIQSGEWLNQALPSNSSTYITLLPPTSEIAHVTFSNALSDKVKFTQRPRIVIIGLDASGTLSPASRGESQYFVRTIFDRQGGDPNLGGTPTPLYWGQLAQTLFDQAFVKVPSTAQNIFLTLAYCLMTLGIMLRFGGVAASGAFVFYVLSSPFINSFSLYFSATYIPIFNSYYFGLSTLVLSGFGRLSHTAWHKWRAQARSTALKEAAELKGHFISLLSHNLNTPVAKMQGMLNLLSQLSTHDPGTEFIQKAERLAAHLQFAIRSVLIATALEEGDRALAARTAKQLSDDFLTSYRGTLRKLGVDLREIHITTVPGDADDLAYAPLSFDMRAVTMAFAGAAYLFSNDQGGHSANVPLTQVDITFAVRERAITARSDDLESSRIGLTATFSSQDTALGQTVRNALDTRSLHGFRGRTEGNFLPEVICGLLMETARSFNGQVSVRDSSLSIDLESEV